MKKSRTEYFLNRIGQLEEVKLFEQTEENHMFSDKYKRNKENMLKSLEKKRRVRGAAAAAIVTTTVLAATVGVYAAVNYFNINVTEEDNDQVRIQVEHTNEESKPYPIKITPKYLPDGYAEDQPQSGKYSPEGEWGVDGITIADSGWCATWEEAQDILMEDVSEVERFQFKESQGILTMHKGYAYPYDMMLYHNESGHAIEIFAAENVSKEDLLKVCDNLEVTILKDSDEEATILQKSTAEQEIIAEETPAISDERVKNIGDSFEVRLSEQTGKIKVTDIQIKDTVDTEKLNENTTYDYATVLECLDGNTPKPFQREVEEWTNEELVSRPINVVNLKNVEVTLKVSNPGDEEMPEMPIQPFIYRYNQQSDGTLVQDSSIPGYEMQDNFRGLKRHPLLGDIAPYYFDASAFTQSTHFYYTALQPQETKTIHIWCLVPEDEIDNSYLEFDLGFEQKALVKIKQ